MSLPRGAADLHIHTTHSDGACSPSEVVNAAKNVGLHAIAITDHDTISALAVARPEAERLGIELVNGVELTTEFEGREYHLLGYYFDAECEAIGEACAELRRGRELRIELMIGKLAELGLRIDLDSLKRVFPRATIGRRHLADWLERTSQVPSQRHAFERFLGDGGVATVPKPRLGVADAINLLRAAGGVAALAHPPYDLRESTLKSFCDAGMRGIEVAGPGIPKSRRARLDKWAREFGLVPVAGSDFHSNDRPGRWIGSTTTSRETLDLLRSMRSEPLTAAR